MRQTKLFFFFILCIFSFILAACQNDKDDDTDNEEQSEPALTISPKVSKIPIHPLLGIKMTAYLDGRELNDNEVIWKSDNTDIAYVLGNGAVFGKKKGEVEITAILVENGSVAKARVIIEDKKSYKFRLTLKDKGISNHTLTNPEKYLSQKAIARRNKFNIPIEETDLPISKEYLEKIEKVGGTIVAQSKWLKTVTVHCDNVDYLEDYLKLPFVQSIKTVWIEKASSFDPEIIEKAAVNNSSYNAADYGKTWDNINLNKGYTLHQAGFKGQGMDIAVIDAGFKDLESNPTLDNLNIKGVKSFIYENKDPYLNDEHGVCVLSTMAGNKPNKYIGTAPEANYWIFSTEDPNYEAPVEEDYWVAALEYADSVGVDIVNTSLYYNTFDSSFDNYNYEDMDGKTAPPTQATNIASKKGMLIVCCAGNHGSWVGTPADSPNALTVGSVNANGNVAIHTAWGITIDGRIKPDVMSRGSSAWVVVPDGSMESRSGTSYASPIMCGIAACLWQAYPELTNLELRDIIIKSSDRFDNPVMPYGYGIPDMEKAMLLAQDIISLK